MTCDIWDTDYNTDNWEPGIMTIFVPWQLIVTLDSIHNSCDVCSWRVISIRYTKHTEICWSQPAACVTGWSSPQGWQPWRQAPHPRTAVPAALPACPGRRPHYCFRPGFDLHWCTFFQITRYYHGTRNRWGTFLLQFKYSIWCGWGAGNFSERIW